MAVLTAIYTRNAEGYIIGSINDINVIKQQVPSCDLKPHKGTPPSNAAKESEVQRIISHIKYDTKYYYITLFTDNNLDIIPYENFVSKSVINNYRKKFILDKPTKPKRGKGNPSVTKHTQKG